MLNAPCGPDTNYARTSVLLLRHLYSDMLIATQVILFGDVDKDMAEMITDESCTQQTRHQYAAGEKLRIRLLRYSVNPQNRI